MKHAKSNSAPTPQPAAEPPPRSPLSGPDLFRRFVILLVTGLVVARPLVLGEDPGLTDPLSDPGSLLLVLLWLVAGVLWGVWRAWSGDSTWHGGLVELGLLALVGTQFLAAGVAAHYQRAAWLVAWEWLAVLAAFVLIRQLSAAAEEHRLFLAAVMATAVCLSAQAVYQAGWTIPLMQEQFLGKPRALLDELRKQGENLDEDDPRVERYLRRLQEGHATATYAHPNSFAGYLVLLIPTACGFVAVAWRQRREQWQVGLLVVAEVLLLLALWFTHSRGGMLALLLVGAAAAVWFWRDLVRRHAFLVGLVLAGLVALAVVAYTGGWLDAATGKQSGSLGLRRDYWQATWSMVLDHPWLGVGPGNFGRHYPQYRLPTAFEDIKDPHNFILELLATSGIVGLAAGLAALGMLLGTTFRYALSTGEETPAEPSSRTPWEFYFGGMLGLLVAFVARTAGLAPQQIGDEAAAALLRSGIWFGTFALYASVPWSGRSLVFALTAGIIALLLNLLVSGGFSQPAVAQPLWIVAALALAAQHRPATVPASTPAALACLWPLPVFLAACLAFFLLAFTPVMNSATHRSQFNLARETFRLVRQKRGDTAALAYIQPAAPPLDQAIKADPGNIVPLIDKGAWCLELAEFLRIAMQDNRSDDFRGLRYIDPAVEAFQQAHQLDPFNREPLLNLFQVYLRFAIAFEEKRSEHLRAAEALIPQILQLYPPDAARLHFELAGTYFKVMNVDAGKRHAQMALELDEKGTSPTHKLTDRQRRQVRQWLEAPAAN